MEEQEKIYFLFSIRREYQRTESDLDVNIQTLMHVLSM